MGSAWGVGCHHDASGKITGTLTFAHGWVALTINGTITPAVEIETCRRIVATGEGFIGRLQYPRVLH